MTKHLSGAGVTTQGLWHYPAVINNASIATEIAQFAPSSDGTFVSSVTLQTFDLLITNSLLPPPQVSLITLAADR